MNKLEQVFSDIEFLLPEYESPWYFFQKGFPFFLEQIQSKMTLGMYKRNTILFSQGEKKPDVFIPKKGVVRIITSDTGGHEKQLMIAGPGSILGIQPWLDGYPCLFTASTAENCEIYKISGESFLQATEGIEGFRDFLVRDLSMKMRVIAGHIDSLSFQAVNIRIIKALLYLINENGIKTEQGIKINIPFTHQEMADLVNSNRVTVSRFFSFLKKEGVLDKCKRYYYVKDVDFLYLYLSNVDTNK